MGLFSYSWTKDFLPTGAKDSPKGQAPQNTSLQRERSLRRRLPTALSAQAVTSCTCFSTSVSAHEHFLKYLDKNQSREADYSPFSPRRNNNIEQTAPCGVGLFAIHSTEGEPSTQGSLVVGMSGISQSVFAQPKAFAGPGECG